VPISINNHISRFQALSLSAFQLLLEMTEQRMDDITTLKPAATIAGAPAMAPATEPTEHSAEQKPVSMDTERPPNEHTIEPLEISEDLPVRSKLRIYTILIALSVDYPVLTPSKH
jgi:hypothetical protein